MSGVVGSYLYKEGLAWGEADVDEDYNNAQACHI